MMRMIRDVTLPYFTQQSRLSMFNFWLSFCPSFSPSRSLDNFVPDAMRLRYRFTFIDVEIEDHEGRSAERRVKFLEF